MSADPHDTEQVVAAFGGMVWALCRRLDPDPEEAYQDCWAHIIPRLDRYDGARGSLKSFLLAIAHRRLVDRHRRRKVRRMQPLGEVPGGTGPEEEVVARRRAQRLERALQRLPPGQRRVVVAHHIHGRELSDIARDEGCALGTVKSRLHRARAALATHLRSAR